MDEADDPSIDAALTAAAAAGISAATFWSQTPHETRLVMRGYVRTERAAYTRSMSAAWHMAAFQRQKKMPDFKRLMGSFKPRKPQSWQDMYEQARRMTIAMGGEIIEPEEKDV